MEENDRPERPDIPDFTTNRTVGEMLVAERRRQGKTLGDIAEITCIRAKMLEALENGSYAKLPSPAYVRGYIQNYASVLGLSAEPFLEAYRTEEPLDASGVPRPHPSLNEPILPHREQAHAIPARLLITVVVIVLLIALTWFFLGLFGAGETITDPLPPTETEDAPVSEPDTVTVPGITDEETLEPTAAVIPTGQTFTLGITVVENDASWLRVTVDGENVYEGILDGGDSRTWDVSEVATVRIGRPSVVAITKDGVPVDIPTTGELPTIEIIADE